MSDTLDVKGTQVFLNGNGAQTIIMIHGWPDTHEIWSKQVAFFQHDYTCVTFTLPGFEKHDRRKWSLDEIIERINDIVQAVSPDKKVILMLHDWGCVFGYEYAMRYPSKIQKAIGIDIGDIGSKDFITNLTLSSKLMLFGYQMTLALGWLFGSDIVHQQMAKALKAPATSDNIHAGMGLPYAMQWLKISGGLTVQAFQPTFPFFYVYAIQKPFFFHTKQWLAKLQSQPENKVQAFDCSHWVMIDQSETFNQSVKDWLSKAS